MLLQRKYDSRLASSNSESGRSTLAWASSGSIRNRNRGDARIDVERDLNCALEALAPIVGQPEDLHQAVDLVGRRGSAERPIGELRDHLAPAFEP